MFLLHLVAKSNNMEPSNTNSPIALKVAKFLLAFMLFVVLIMALGAKSVVAAVLCLAAMFILPNSIAERMSPQLPGKNFMLSVVMLIVALGFAIRGFNQGDEDLKAQQAAKAKAEYEALPQEVKDSIEAEKAIQAAANRFKNLEKYIVEHQFSGWNGEHRKLVKLVKQNMNDPESFEHVATRYKVYADSTVFVQMDYRGKNAFGALIKTTIAATCNFNGDILEVKQ